MQDYAYGSSKVIARRLDYKGRIDARASHIDNRVTTLCTFLPYETDIGGKKVEKTVSGDLPVIIFCNGKQVWFDFITEPDQVFFIDKKKYQVQGYPQRTRTMLSMEAFIDMFGTNPQPRVLKPMKKVLPDVNPDTILSDIEKILKQYIGFFDSKGKLRKDLYKLVAYWIVQTYIYDVWSKTSYLKVGGVHDSGKSTLSRLLQLLCFCSERSTAKVTDSNFFRSLHCVGGVQCLDEMKITEKESPILLNILKSGFTKESFIRLTDRKDHNKSEEFNVFSPKIVAGTQAMELDSIISSRMIEITMRTAPARYNFSKMDLYDEEALDITRKLRDRLYAFRLKFGHTYLTKKNVEGDEIGVLGGDAKKVLKNRQLDLFSPTLTLAQLHGGRTFMKSVVRAIEEQVEIKESEFVDNYDTPILQVIWEAVSSFDDIWLSAVSISDSIIENKAGNDQNKRRYYMGRYNPEQVGTHIKNLGLFEAKRNDLSGPAYRFNKVDIKAYLTGKGINVVLEPMALHDKMVELVRIMADIQGEDEDYERNGIPFETIYNLLDYNPNLPLHNLVNQRDSPIEKKKNNRWRVTTAGEWLNVKK